MVLTTFPTDQGSGRVRAKITAHTICKPHGLVEAGQIVDLDYAEFVKLKENGKAERVQAKAEPVKPATLEELEAEVRSRGYSEEAAKKIAQDRFDGVHGEGAKFLGPQQPVSEQLGGDGAEGVGGDEELVEESVFRAALENKTKAEIVALAAQEFKLELDESSKKAELIEAVLKAAGEAK